MNPEIPLKNNKPAEEKLQESTRKGALEIKYDEQDAHLNTAEAEKNKKGKQTRRAFLRDMAEMATVAAMGGATIKKLSNRIENVEEAPDDTEGLPTERTEQEKERILKDFSKLCNFYLDTVSGRTVNKDNPENARDYVLSMLKTYLAMNDLAWDFRRRHLANENLKNISSGKIEKYITPIIGDCISKKQGDDQKTNRITLPHEAVVLMEYLNGRFHLSIEIQKIIRKKISEKGFAIAARQFTIDGRLGSNSLALCENICRGKFWDSYQLFERAEIEGEDQVLELLHNGELSVAIPKFTEQEIAYMRKLYDNLRRKYPLAEWSKQPFNAIVQRFHDIDTELQEHLESETDTRRTKLIQIAFFNYYMDLWDGSPAELKDGSAKYPYEPGKISDCTTFVFQALRRLFPEIPPQIQLGGSFEQVRDYGTYFHEKPVEMTEHNLKNSPSIFVVDANNHMFIVSPDLHTGFFSRYEASEGSVRTSAFFGSEYYKGVSMSSTQSLKKMTRKTPASLNHTGQSQT